MTPEYVLKWGGLPFLFFPVSTASYDGIPAGKALAIRGGDVERDACAQQLVAPLACAERS